MIYLLAFDPHKVDAKSLHNVINSSPYIKTWWHYIGSTYLISSSYTLKTVKNDIKSRWPDQRYIIVKIDTDSYAGWLPQKAWDWIERNKS
jgi:hypothetical protein